MCSPKKEIKTLLKNLIIGSYTSLVFYHVVKISWSLTTPIEKYYHSKLEKKFFRMLACNFTWLWLPFVESFWTMKFELKAFYIDHLSQELGKKFQKKHTWFSFIKKLLSRSRSEIEQNTKLLIALRWNWNTMISILRLFLQTNLILLKNFEFLKIAFKNEFYRLIFQEDV